MDFDSITTRLSAHSPLESREALSDDELRHEWSPFGSKLSNSDTARAILALSKSSYLETSKESAIKQYSTCIAPAINAASSQPRLPMIVS